MPPIYLDEQLYQSKFPAGRDGFWRGALSATAEAAPTVLGIGGQLVGGALGLGGGTVAGIETGPGAILTGLAGARAGQIAGGAVGQAGGETLKKYIQQRILRDQPIESAGEFAKGVVGEGVAGGIYSALPGGTISKKIIGRLAERAGAGALTAGGAQTVRNIVKGRPVSENLPETAVAGGALNIAIPEVTGLLGKGAKFFGERIPKDIVEQVIGKPQALLKQLTDKVKQTLVGHANVDYALKRGIIPQNAALTTDEINKYYANARLLSQEIEKQLQSNVKDVYVPYREVMPGLIEIAENIPPLGPNRPETEKIINWLTNQALKEGVPSAKVGEFVKGETLISLGKILDIKRSINDAQYAEPVYFKMYNYIKEYIENKSGLPEKVKALNREHAHLIDIKTSLSKLKKQDVLPAQITPEGIEKAVELAERGDVRSLQALIGMISLTSVFLGAPIAEGAIGSLGLAPGMRTVAGLGTSFALYRLMKDILADPKLKENVANVLSKNYTGIKKTIDASQLTRILQQMGIRIPGGFAQ